MFFLIVNKRGYLPSSPRQATLDAFLFTPKYNLQNLILTFSISEDFGHFFNFLKTVQKGIKLRLQSLKTILKGLAFVLE